MEVCGAGAATSCASLTMSQLQLGLSYMNLWDNESGESCSALA